MGEYDLEKRALEGKIYQDIQRINLHAETFDDKVESINA